MEFEFLASQPEGVASFCGIFLPLLTTCFSADEAFRLNVAFPE
jgi:hypothetical protein